jgi:hypothetical protein
MTDNEITAGARVRHVHTGKMATAIRAAAELGGLPLLVVEYDDGKRFSGYLQDFELLPAAPDNTIPAHLQTLWDDFQRATRLFLTCPPDLEYVAGQVYEDAFDALRDASRDSDYVITATGLVKA